MFWSTPSSPSSYNYHAITSSNQYLEVYVEHVQTIVIYFLNLSSTWCHMNLTSSIIILMISFLYSNTSVLTFSFKLQPFYEYLSIAQHLLK